MSVFACKKSLFKLSEKKERKKENFKIVAFSGARTLNPHITGVMPLPERPRTHQLWEATTFVPFILHRKALTRVLALRHNAAAPIPAPQESYAPHPELGMLPFEHYADPVWDNVRMNNILQHAATGLFDHYVKNDKSAPDLAQASAEHDIPGTRFEFLPAG